MATLTLRQCIAATRTPYEEAFCLGEHALIDTASCVGWVVAPPALKTNRDDAPLSATDLARKF
ncbi:MAG: hypothetical protein R3C55_11145 [Parvularculaceae bacterium]